MGWRTNFLHMAANYRLKGVHLLLGNDLAGDKVVVNPLLTNTPCVDQPPDPIGLLRKMEILDSLQFWLSAFYHLTVVDKSIKS